MKFKYSTQSAATVNTPLPTIHISTDIGGVVSAGLTAIRAVDDPPILFHRAGRLCRIVCNGQTPKWLRRAPDAPVIAPVQAATLSQLAASTATWEKFDARARQWRPSLPPPWFALTALEQGAWDLPYLEAVVTHPVLRPDGSVLETPGYDQDTGLFYAPSGPFPPVPRRPTLDDARAAVDTFQDITADFPFLDTSHQSAAWAALLTVVVRHAIPGCVPLFAIRSNTRGSGKSLLVDALSLAGTGRPVARWADCPDNDEYRKRLLSIALAGDPVTCIDNVQGSFGSAALDMALTAGIVADRLLGGNETVEVPWNAIVFVTGNNVHFRGDTARRTLPIDLDPRMEKPEQRANFRHAPLLTWVHIQRPALVRAALTFLRSYLHDGAPSQHLPQWGSFEGWSDWVRSALVWAGEPDPATTRSHLEVESDPGYSDLEQLLEAWQTCYGTTPKTLRAAKQDIDVHKNTVSGTPDNEWNLLETALEAYDTTRRSGQSFDLRAVGNSLRAVLGRVIDNKRLMRSPFSNSKGTKYGLEQL